MHRISLQHSAAALEFPDLGKTSGQVVVFNTGGGHVN